MFHSIMNESGRWLVGKGKIDRAINILKVIAKRNSRRVEDSIWRSFEVGSNKDNTMLCVICLL